MIEKQVDLSNVWQQDAGNWEGHVQISFEAGTGLVVNAAAVNNNCICGIIVVSGLFEDKTMSGRDYKPYT